MSILLRHFAPCFLNCMYDIIDVVMEMIKENRIKKGFTQEELAEIINISPRQLQRIEKNEDKTRIETIRKIIKVLQIQDKEIIDYLKK